MTTGMTSANSSTAIVAPRPSLPSRKAWSHMLWARTSVPWWPPVMARTMSKSFSVAMKTVTATTTMAERIDGTVTFQKICEGLAR